MCEFHHELNKELVAAFFTAQYVARTLKQHEHLIQCLKSKTKSVLNLTVSLETSSSDISAAKPTVVTSFLKSICNLCETTRGCESLGHLLSLKSSCSQNVIFWLKSSCPQRRSVAILHNCNVCDLKTDLFLRVNDTLTDTLSLSWPLWFTYCRELSSS